MNGNKEDFYSVRKIIRDFLRSHLFMFLVGQITVLIIGTVIGTILFSNFSKQSSLIIVAWQQQIDDKYGKLEKRVSANEQILKQFTVLKQKVENTEKTVEQQDQSKSGKKSK